MSALISAPDLDPFALLSSRDYRTVRDRLERLCGAIIQAKPKKHSDPIHGI